MPVEEDEMSEHSAVRRRFSNLEELLDRRAGPAFALRIELHDVEGWWQRRITFLVMPWFWRTGWCTLWSFALFAANLPNSPWFLDFRHFRAYGRVTDVALFRGLFGITNVAFVSGPVNGIPRASPRVVRTA
jgi:hypothetical protein